MVAKAKRYTSDHVRAAAYLDVEMEAEALFATMDLPKYQLRRLDLQSITAQSSMNIEPTVHEENQTNDLLEVLEASPKGSPTNPKLPEDSHQPVSRHDGDSNLSLPHAQEPSVRRRVSLEFAPWGDEDGPNF
jgi:hypothetical protein